MLVATVFILIALFMFGFTSYIPILVGFGIALVLFFVLTLATNSEEKEKIQQNWEEYQDRCADNAIEETEVEK